MTRRLFVDQLPAVGESVVLDSESANHVRVLRLVADAEVELFDGRGSRASARLEQVDGETVRCIVLQVSRVASNAPFALTLVQAMPKGDKLESIVRMATEIGVDEIRFVISERTVSRPDAAKGAAKTERLTRVVREAARQSEQATLPSLLAPVEFAAAVAALPADTLHLVFVPGGDTGIEDVRDRAASAKSVWVWVGPEGGFSPSEIASLTRLGCISVRMFESVLRVETAAPVAVALVRSALFRSR